MARLKPTVRGSILGLILALLTVAALGPARLVLNEKLAIASAERRQVELNQQNRQLQSRLDRLKDPEYVEKLARQQLGLTKPGETSYVVVPGPQAKPSPAPQSHQKSWVQSTIDWFRKLL
jgi:cell division protein DivIC